VYVKEECGCWQRRKEEDGEIQGDGIENESLFWSSFAQQQPTFTLILVHGVLFPW
jgi:hypothetical protein